MARQPAEVRDAVRDQRRSLAGARPAHQPRRRAAGRRATHRRRHRTRGRPGGIGQARGGQRPRQAAARRAHQCRSQLLHPHRRHGAIAAAIVGRRSNRCTPARWRRPRSFRAFDRRGCACCACAAVRPGRWPRDAALVSFGAGATLRSRLAGRAVSVRSAIRSRRSGNAVCDRAAGRWRRRTRAVARTHCARRASHRDRAVATRLRTGHRGSATARAATAGRRSAIARPRRPAPGIAGVRYHRATRWPALERCIECAASECERQARSRRNIRCLDCQWRARSVAQQTACTGHARRSWRPFADPFRQLRHTHTSGRDDRERATALVAATRMDCGCGTRRF